MADARKKPAPKRTSKRTLADDLRAAIRKAERRGITRYQIAKDAGVSEGQLSRLMHGTVDPRLNTAQRIIEAIGGKIRIDLS
jgi:predicted transcriptional regulator